MTTPDEIESMLDDLENRQSKLSDWETNFVDSLRSQLGHGRSLTDRQIETLEKIWNRVT